MNYATLNKAIRAQLMADAEVAAMTNGVIRRKRIARDIPNHPFVIIGARGQTRHEANCGEADGIARAPIQLTAWAMNADDADVLGDAVRRCFQEKRGVIGAGEHTVKAHNVTLESDQEVQEPRSADAHEFYEGVEFNFTFIFEESVGV